MSDRMRKFILRSAPPVIHEAAQFDGTWPSAEPYVTQYGAEYLPGSLVDNGVLIHRRRFRDAYKGDWIVRNPANGRLAVFGPEEFAALYQPLDPPPDVAPPAPPEPEIS